MKARLWRRTDCEELSVVDQITRNYLSLINLEKLNFVFRSGAKS
jgi:hypothetical protein